MKRLESRKSHSWWWDSHINPKNSKWLAENLEEMGHAVKRMMKLIEDDGDSFAKKAEMYYRKRPELISHVEEFYRMYRSLAERYDHLTGELRKNIPSDLQSQGSGISDISFETPPPDLKLARRRSGQQAAGFEFFLGSGGISDHFNREGDESSSLTDSEPECDTSSVNNYIGNNNSSDQGLQTRVVELENELQEIKENIRIQQEETSDGAPQVISSLVAKFENDLRISLEKNRLAEEEISRLKNEIRKYQSQVVDQNSLDLTEDMKILKEKLHHSRIEILSLKKEVEAGNSTNSIRSCEKNKQMMDQLESAVKDAASWKTKFNAERREVTKLQERLIRLKASLSDRDHEIRELKLAVSDAEEKIFPEKAQIKVELSRLIEERGQLEGLLREWELRGRSMEEEIRRVKAEMSGAEEGLKPVIAVLRTDVAERDRQLENLKEKLDELQLERNGLKDEVLKLREDISGKNEEIDRRLKQLQKEYDIMVAGLRSRAEELEEEVERQKIAILEGAEEKREAIRQLCFCLDYYRNMYHKFRHEVLNHKQFNFGQHVVLT